VAVELLEGSIKLWNEEVERSSEQVLQQIRSTTV